MIAPSAPNHWCQAPRPSPSASTSPTAISWTSGVSPCRRSPSAFLTVLRPPSQPTRYRVRTWVPPHGRGHAVGVLAEVAQFGPPLDGDAETGQALAQRLLHPRLRDHQAGRVGDIRRDRPAGLRIGLGDHLRAPVLAVRQMGDPGLEQLADHAEVVEHFLAARAQPLAARPAGELRRLVDDADRDAAPGQVAGDCQAGRAGASHENISVRHARQ